ncbi:MAG: 50S ribosomal protein L4, partial [Raoultibacter sp.]
EDFGFEKPSTKQAAAAIKALGCEGRTTVVVADDDVNAYLSLRNLEKVNVIPVAEANTYELIDNKKLIFTAAALSRIEEVLA